jgi:hypothetical protein
MMRGDAPLGAIKDYLRGRPRWVRWRERLRGRRYSFALFGRCADSHPLVVIAHSFRDTSRAGQLVQAVEEDWPRVPATCREAYEEILERAPGVLVVQLRRTNICGCLGHRHLVVKEAPFAEPHDALGGAPAGEMDIAYDRVEGWLASPLMDTALDTQFMAGSRLEDFRAAQLRLRLLSILLHEAHHMVYPREPEDAVRNRSVGFYRDALASYVENTRATMSLTIDRSFSRFGRD